MSIIRKISGINPFLGLIYIKANMPDITKGFWMFVI